MTTAANQEGTQPDILSMSDEEFSKLNGIPPVPEKTAEEIAAEQEAAAKQAEAAEAQRLADEQAEAERKAAEANQETEEQKAARLQAEAEEASKNAANGGKVTPEGNEGQVDPNVTANPTATSTAVEGKNGEQKTVVAETPVDYKKMYEQIVAPFKANGKQIEIRTPEEAIQLMQMGANYTRKMQEIQPHRKVLMMLENNGLMDEGKLSYLIDLDKRNPEAIKKLIKDSGVDPLTIDVEAGHSYQGGSHSVSDAEVNFRTVLDDMSSSEAGNETLQHVNKEWDQASKEALWKDPAVLTTVHEHRTNGVYKIVADEVNRLRTLGHIPANVSFIQAYHSVGEELNKQGAFAKIVKPVVAPVQAAQPVAVQAATVKAPVKNDAAVNAAASTRSSSKKAETFVNPLAMSDDEFLKQMANRV